MGLKQGTHGSKTVGSPKPTLKSRKPKKSKSTAPEVINIMKPGGDKAKIQLRHTKDQQLQGSILSGETLPVM